MFQIAQMGCACGEGSGACAKNCYSWMEKGRPFLGAESAFSFLAFCFPHGEDRALASWDKCMLKSD